MKATELPPFSVLVVEDNPFILATVVVVLRSLGATRIGEAADGSAALAILEDGFGPDVILCDINMTPMSGPAFLRRLRASADAAWAACPVILLGGDITRATIAATAAYNVSLYLEKPFTRKRLAEGIRPLLEPPLLDRAEPALPMPGR